MPDVGHDKSCSVQKLSNLHMNTILLSENLSSYILKRLLHKDTVGKKEKKMEL